MADKKISQLTNLTGANLADNDEFVLVDTSADETKAITWSELKEGLDTGTGFVRITGDTMTGDLSFDGGDTIYGDNDKAIFGAGSDLQIYHTGDHSYIDEAGTGNLYLNSNGSGTIIVGGGGTQAQFFTGGAVNLYHNNAQKLATTSTGIDVTGTVTADGLSVDGGTIKLDGNYPVENGNVALGNAALDAVATGGAYNTALGSDALTDNTTGSRNTAVGQGGLADNTTGSYNTAVGRESLFSNTTASNNTAVGYQAGYANTTGDELAALGYQALAANTTGRFNTAIGSRTLVSNTTASNNTGIGYGALNVNTTGANNTALGYFALVSNTTAGSNTAVGYQAGYSNTTGGSNVGIGQQALKSNTTASSNTAVGYQAGYYTTTGTGNLLLGSGAGLFNTTGYENVYLGRNAGYSSTGYDNTFVGGAAGYSSTGAGNTFLGRSAGQNMINGSNNTILGRYNGNQGGLDIRTSSNNIVLSDGDGNPRIYIDGSGYVRKFVLYGAADYSNDYTYTQATYGTLYSTLIPTGILQSNSVYLVTIKVALAVNPYYADTSFIFCTAPGTNGEGAGVPIDMLTSSHVNSPTIYWSVRHASGATSTNGLQGLLNGGPNPSSGTQTVKVRAIRIGVSS